MFDPDKYLAEKEFDPDAYLSSKGPPAPKVESAPTEKRNIRGELVGPSTFENVVKGAADFATGASSLMRGIGNIPGKAIDAVRGPKLDELVTGKQKGDTGYYGDFAFPKSTESGALKFAGELADPLAWTIGGGVAKALPYVKMGGQGLVKGLQAFGKNAGSGAVAGGTIGALSDEGSATTGAGFGALANTVIPPVFGGVARGVTAAKQALYPTPGALGVKAAGDKADDVINALMSQRSGVPGVNLHAGQASVPANSAEFAAFQKKVADMDPSRYFGPKGVSGQQEAARLGSLQTIGKTPAELEAALSVRSSAADQNYEAAFGEVIKRDKDLRELWKNPYFKDEVGEAWKLLRAQKLPLKENLTEFLHHVKTGMDARLQSANNPNAPAISKSTQNAVSDAKQKLLSWLEAKNPAYENARTTHISLSKPINQMKLGQEIERALTAPVSGAERAASFGTAVRQAENTVSKATGKPRIDDLSKRQKALIDAIEADLKRSVEYKGLASAGAKNLESRVPDPEIKSLGVFNPFFNFARGKINQVLRSGQENALRKASPMMETPQAFARAMQSATPQHQAAIRSELAKYLARTATIGAAQNDESAQKRSAYARALKE